MFYFSLKRDQQNLNKALFEAAVILAAVALGRDIRSMASMVNQAAGNEENCATVATNEAKANTAKSGAVVSSRNNSPKFQVIYY